MNRMFFFLKTVTMSKLILHPPRTRWGRNERWSQLLIHSIDQEPGYIHIRLGVDDKELMVWGT